MRTTPHAHPPVKVIAKAVEKATIWAVTKVAPRAVKAVPKAAAKGDRRAIKGPMATTVGPRVTKAAHKAATKADNAEQNTWIPQVQ